MRQEQTLAPQQILSLEFLMAPVMELEEKVELELSSNPVLELDEKREEPSSGEADDPYADLPALP
ncbi:MAG: RNA polymerase sigma-54 factor, partial [Lentisphaeria bacterium]|nr:RNA polymerase sigma-54 factor [Lentisphaeria bacterium]